MPVLTPGSSPLRVLHLSDFHMRPAQRRKQAWLRELARWEPDLVINTGDNLAHPKAVPAVVQAMGDLLSVPGLFVFGSNDYFGPKPKNPTNYLFNRSKRDHGRAAAVAGPAGGVHRTRLARHDPHPPRDRGQRPADRRGRRRRSAPAPRPVRHDRRQAQPGRQPDPRAHALAGTAGAGPLRRRRLPAGDGGPHPRRPAVRAVLRRHRHQLRPGPVAGQGPVAVGCRHAAARVGGHRDVAVRAGTGSAAGPRRRC